VTVIEQDLGKEASCRVAHDDRRFVKLAYDALEVLDDRRDSQSLNRGGILVERFDLDLKAWVGGGEHTVTTALVALDPPLPASGGDPQTVDQHDGVRSGRGGGVLSSHSVLLESTSPRM
jgi:hypothetical protein